MVDKYFTIDEEFQRNNVPLYKPPILYKYKVGYNLNQLKLKIVRRSPVPEYT